jgi:ABC-type lipoprotein release transport system permease subunit
MGTVVLVVLIGTVGGGVVAAAAGARRTSSAYDRMVRSVRAADILVNPNLGVETNLDLDAVAALPEVDEAGIGVGVAAFVAGSDGEPDFEATGIAIATTDGRALVTIDRPHVLSGRLPHQAEPDEALVNPPLADRFELSPGDHITVLTASAAGGSSVEAGGGDIEFTPVDMIVTGIGIMSDEVVDDESWAQGRIVYTQAFYERHRDTAYFIGLWARLHGGADAAQAFRADVERLAGDEAVAFQTLDVTSAITDRAIRPSAMALAVFAAFAGLAGLLVVVHALTRQLADDRAEAGTLAALGMTHSERWGSVMIRLTVVAVAGAALAVAIGVALSPLTPVDIARLAEPDPGFSVDGTVLVVSVVVLAVLLPGLVAWPAWRAMAVAPERLEVTSRSRVGDALARRGAPPSAVVGVHYALEPGRSRTAVPTRSTLVITALAVAATTAAIVFAAGLDQLVRTPRLYGWNWDVYVNDGEGPTEADWSAAVSSLAANPDVAAVARGNNGELTLDGRPVPTIGLEVVRGDVGLTIAEGQAPSAGDEVALGTRTLRQLGAEIGDRVEVTAADGTTRDLTIVGRAVFPGFGTYSGADNTELGTGALVTRATLKELGPAFDKPFIVVDIRRGAAPVGPDLFGDRDDLVRNGKFILRATPLRPADVVHIDRIGSIPVVLSILLAGFALATLTHSLVTSTRQRARELAVLRVLGFGRGQVGGAVAAHATTVAVIALLFGIPVGIALGRWAWILVANGLATPAATPLPVLVLVIGAAATVLFANLVAVAPAWRASHVPPGPALRAE